MRNLRKLSLLATLVVAALAIMAPSASAAVGNLIVSDEATGSVCPNVSPSDSSEFPVAANVTGGCVGHAVNAEGQVTLTAHIFGIESSDSVCNNEFTARLGGNGEGYLTGVTLTGASCTRRPCDNASGQTEAWEIHGEETAAGVKRLEAHFCVENVSDGGGRTTCHLFIPFADTGNHVYEFGTVNASDVPQEVGCEGFTGFRGEVSGHWRSEDGTFEASHPS